MPTEIKMPNLSQTTDEVKLLRWLVKEDDKVNKGDLLCEVETDKVNMEVESFASGTVLKLIGKPGDQIKTETIIVILGKEGKKPLLIIVLVSRRSNVKILILVKPLKKKRILKKPIA